MSSRRSVPLTPALLVGRIRHRRREGVSHRFSHGYSAWLIDVDAPPRWGWLTRLLAHFDSRDFLQRTPSPHFGGTIRQQLAAAVAEHGLRLDDSDRVLMLALPRQFGHTFNPLTMYWCYGADGTQRWAVAEVHNTYGGQHLYVLDAASADLTKRLYVSPFHDVSGRYRLTHRLEPDRVAVHVALHREGAPPFTASVEGRLIPANQHTLLAAAVRYPALTWQVSALIRVHGIYLWVRRLRVQPRPPSAPMGSSRT